MMPGDIWPGGPHPALDLPPVYAMERFLHWAMTQPEAGPIHQSLLALPLVGPLFHIFPKWEAVSEWLDASALDAR